MIIIACLHSFGVVYYAEEHDHRQYPQHRPTHPKIVAENQPPQSIGHLVIMRMDVAPSCIYIHELSESTTISVSITLVLYIET